MIGGNTGAGPGTSSGANQSYHDSGVGSGGGGVSIIDQLSAAAANQNQ